jgi:hypothetical protein
MGFGKKNRIRYHTIRVYRPKRADASIERL